MAESTLTPEERAAKRREQMRQYYKDNKDKLRAAQHVYYEENKQEIKAINNQWAQENKEKMRAYKRKWRVQNPGEAKAAILRWREENVDRERTVARQSYEKSKETRLAFTRQWQRENPGKVRAARRRWVQNHPDRARANHANRQSRKIRHMPAWIPVVELNDVYRNCPPGMQVDHIVPLRGVTADGCPISGLHLPWNLQYLTASANYRKYNRMRPEDHAAAEAPVEAPRQLRLFD